MKNSLNRYQQTKMSSFKNKEQEGISAREKLMMSETWLLPSSSQMQQTLAQMHILKEDKEHSTQEMHQLKTTLVQMRSQLVEPPSP
jgi:hypothetical protein